MALTWYPGKCQVSFTHSENPLVLPTRGGPKRTLSEICKDQVPECYLNPFLFNGHLQTAWTAVKAKGPAIHYKRRVFEAEDQAFKGHFTVDFVVKPPPPRTDKVAEDGGLDDQGLREDPVGIGHKRLPPRTTYFTDKEFENLPSNDTKPLLITLHGLSGGSYENYLRQVLEPLVLPSSDGEEAGGISGGDWEALVVNSRGCAGSNITTSILYNARATWDVRQVVAWCRKTWPKRPLFAIGYSLGANILTNYLGEEGSNCIISAAVIVCNPWKLEVGSLGLQRSYLGMEVYSKTMGGHLRKLFDTHEEVLTQNKSLDVDVIRSLKYLYEFDREVQCATWGYPTEGAYYRDASSADSVMAIRIPVLALHARDDPIVANECVPLEEIKQNPYVVLCETSSGGHLSWFQWGGQRWHPKPIVAFLNAMARTVDFANIEPPVITTRGPRGGHETPFVFEPMRRKLHLPHSDQ